MAPWNLNPIYNKIKARIKCFFPSLNIKIKANMEKLDAIPMRMIFTHPA